MADILAERIGTAGVITLNKPETLNALTHAMVKAIAAALDRWTDDASVRHVVIRAAGGRAFSAGGDIRDLYLRGRTHYAEMMGFFADEYRLNTRIKEYPKPYIALIDGIVMGGGVGVSVNGRYRVGTPNIRFAMPEVGIGFFPDVGGTYFLPRFPGRFGHYCALTGARLKQEECAAAGVITHTIAAEALATLLHDLTETTDAPALLAEACGMASEAPEPGHAATIAACFDEATVEAVLDRLDGVGGDEAGFAAETAATIRAKSPTSVKIALRQTQVGATASFRDCMTAEYRIVSKVLKGHDFYEGVRATIIDKDNRPRWQPASLAEVADADIDAYFAAPEHGDLTFPT